jgi:hypothetical protein
MAALAAVPEERRVEIRYEDFIEDPEAHTASLVEFLDLAPDPAVSETARAARTNPINVVTPPEMGKWRRENPTEIEAVIPLLKPTMEAMGYGLAN